MHIEQALKMAIALIQAVEQAVVTDSSIVTLTSALQAADDAARDELAAAIEAASQRVGGTD
jgi:hypothetical protein